MFDVHLLRVYISTRLEVCEQRDRKGLYARARANKIKGVTGIDDLYIQPSNPDITIDILGANPRRGSSGDPVVP